MAQELNHDYMMILTKAVGGYLQTIYQDGKFQMRFNLTNEGAANLHNELIENGWNFTKQGRKDVYIIRNVGIK